MRSPHRAEPAGQAPTPSGRTATPDTEAGFALALRETVQGRGLSLDPVRERLATRGISISLATLSYWQRGRSQPEQAHSLRARAPSKPSSASGRAL